MCARLRYKRRHLACGFWRHPCRQVSALFASERSSLGTDKRAGGLFAPKATASRANGALAHTDNVSGAGGDAHPATAPSPAEVTLRLGVGRFAGTKTGQRWLVLKGRTPGTGSVTPLCALGQRPRGPPETARSRRAALRVTCGPCFWHGSMTGSPWCVLIAPRQ